MAFPNKSLAQLIVIALLGIAVYSNVLDSPFHFDDESNIVQNPLIKDFKYIMDPSRAKEASIEYNFLKAHIFENRIVGYLSLAMNYRFHGLNVRGYHIANISVHIMNAFLAYWIVVLTFKTSFLKESSLAEHVKSIALLSAFLFVAHPIQTQAVTYVVQRFASLATLLYLASLAAYIKARLAQRSPARYGLYAVSLLSAVLAMKTKEMAFTLPVVIALYEFIFFSAPIRRRLMYLAPVLLTMLIIPMGILDTGVPLGEMLGDAGQATRLETGMPRLDYLFTEFRVVATYIRLLFLPINQNLDYDYPHYGSFFDAQVFMSFLLLASIAGTGAFLLRRSRVSMPELRVVSFGIFWFFIALSVESSLVPIDDVIFEHRLYLPSVGAFLALAAGGAILAEKHRQASKSVLFLTVVVCIVFSVAAYARNAVWKSELTLWSDVVAKAPGNARAHNNLGYAYEMEGNLDKALAHYDASLALEPDVKTYLNISSAYKNIGNLHKAVEYLERAISISPTSAQPYNNLGVIYFYNMGQPDMAIEKYKFALRLEPRNAKTHLNIGIAYRSKGLTAKADYHMGVARSLAPELFGGHPAH